MPKPDVVNLSEKFALIEEHWSPKIAGELHGLQVKLAKLKGEFVWHRHDDEDELFLVLHGRLQIKFRDGDVWLEEGEFAIVPKGTEHQPVAPEEVHLLLLEPSSTRNTGDVRDHRTIDEPDWI